MGQLATDIHNEAAAHIPATPPASPADLLTGPQLLAVFAKVEAAVAALELLQRGARIVRTAGAPDDLADGEDGDLGINLATTDLLAKSGGHWSVLFRLKGEKGDTVKGDTGLSAYQVAQANGFVGSPAQWLASLGRAGNDGKSAYQVAQAGGFAGTVQQWLDSLKVQGDAGQRGNTIRWESYAPSTEAGLAGDAWYYVISAAKVTIYECYQAGSTTTAWRQRYTSPDAPAATTVTPTPSSTFTPTTTGNGTKFLSDDGTYRAVATSVITENTSSFYTPTSAAAKALYGAVPLSIHAALEALAASQNTGAVVSQPVYKGKPVQIIQEGDSITFGYGSADPATQSYPAQLQALEGTTNYLVRNVGTSGERTPQMLAEQQAEIINNATNTYSYTVASLLAGVNDINNIPLSQTKANQETWHRKNVSNGIFSLAVTLLPASGLQLAIDEINAHIRANWQAWGCIGLVDLAANTYYDPTDRAKSVEGLHWLPVANAVTAAMFKDRLDQLLAVSGVPITVVSGPSADPAATTAAMEETDTNVFLLGNWITYSNGVRSSGNQAKAIHASDAMAGVSFSGTVIAVDFAGYQGFAIKMEVWLDGAFQGYITTNASDTVLSNRFLKYGLVDTTHHLQLVCRASDAADGWIDRFRCRGAFIAYAGPTILPAQPAILKPGTYEENYSSRASGRVGSWGEVGIGLASATLQRVSGIAGDYEEGQFSGTQLTLKFAHLQGYYNLFDVFVDGVLDGTVDQDGSQPSLDYTQNTPFVSKVYPDGLHSYKIVNKNVTILDLLIIT